MNFDIFKDLPYVAITNKDELNNRSIVLEPFFQNNEWKIPIVDEKADKIIYLTGKPVHTEYISKVNYEPNSDLNLNFLDIYYNYMSWQDINYHFSGLMNDIINLFISISKIDLFQSIKNNRIHLCDFVSTEIEYLLVICKSIFDTLQKIISILWNNHFQLVEGLIKKNLPETFRKMLILDNKPLDLSEIKEKYNLPEPLANYYIGTRDFYLKLKKIRDDIVHHNKSIKYIYVTNEGFGIGPQSLVYKFFNSLWKNNEKLHPNIYSIRPFLHHIIDATISSCEK